MGTDRLIEVSITYDTEGQTQDDKPWIVHLPTGDIIRKRSVASARAYCCDMGWKPFMGPLRSPLKGDRSQ